MPMAFLRCMIKLSCHDNNQGKEKYQKTCGKKFGFRVPCTADVRACVYLKYKKCKCLKLLPVVFVDA